MKRLFTLLFIVTTTLVLFACSDSGSTGSEQVDRNTVEDSEKPYEGVELNVIMEKDPGKEELAEKFIPIFEKETGMTVNVELVPESGYATKLNIALSSGTDSYDVVTTGVKNWSQLVSSDWLEPLDEYYDNASDDYKKGFSEELLDTLRLDGSLYALPYSVGADLLFYNKEMFEEAGLDPDNPPKNMEELLEYAEILHKPEENQAGFVARGTREGNQNSFSWIMMWLKNGGSWGDDPENPEYVDILNQEAAIKTMEQYTDLLKEYGPRGIESYGFNEAQLAMQQGEAAMWLDAAQLGPALEDETKSKIAGNVGYQKLEGLSEEDKYISGAIWGFSLVNMSENKEAAFELIKYLTSEEVLAEQVITGSMGSPGREDVLENEKVLEQINPEYADALKDAIKYAYPNYSPTITEGEEIRAMMSIAISKVLSGESSAEEALEEANDGVKQLLK